MRDRLTMPFSNWAIEPGKVEGAHAYVCRLVDDEGHNSVRVYSNWIEVNGRNVVPAEMLEVVLRLPISDERRRRLAHATPVQRDGSYWLGGQRFALHDLSFSTRRWCAACLAEKAYHRSLWDMRLAKEGIVRSTRWATMRDGGRDHVPDWKRICAELMPDPAEQKALAATLSEFAEHLRQAPAMAKNMFAASEILERPMGRCIEIADSVLAACQ